MDSIWDKKFEFLIENHTPESFLDTWTNYCYAFKLLGSEVMLISVRVIEFGEMTIFVQSRL